MENNWAEVPMEELRAAAEGGDAGAQFEMGRKTEDYGDAAGAARWYLAAAEQGHAEAQGEVGVCFYTGKGVDRDFEQALRWYRKGAEQGDARAQCGLGACFYNGAWVAQDYAEGVSWFHKAAEQGYVGAQYNIGIAFSNGNGVDKNLSEAASWYHKAAEQGSTAACEEYGTMLMKGTGVARNCEEALVWLRRHPNSRHAREKILRIERNASELQQFWLVSQTTSQTTFKHVVKRICAGESVFGKTPNEGNTLLHTAAANLALESVALLLEHPLFDDLVVQTNNAGQLAREVVGDNCRGAGCGGMAAQVIASALSCRRSTRAACLMWCLEQTADDPTFDRRMVLPREVGKLIARFMDSPHGNNVALWQQIIPGDVAQQSPFDVAQQLARSVQSSWRHTSVSVGEAPWRLAVVRTEASARAQVEWLREEARSLRGRILAAESAHRKLAGFVRDGAVVLEMSAEQHRIGGMHAKLLAVADAKRSLLRRIGEDAFKTELSSLAADGADIERQIGVEQQNTDFHAEHRAFDLAAASQENVAALQQRLAEVQAEASEIRAELVAIAGVSVASSLEESAATLDRGAKRGADELQSGSSGERPSEGDGPDSKRARSDP
jgi:Sel1 repeat